MEAQLLAQYAAQVAIARKRVGLPAGAVQSQHQGCQRPLAQRIVPVQLLELWDKLRPDAERQPGLEHRLGCADPQLIDAVCVAECR